MNKYRQRDEGYVCAYSSGSGVAMIVVTGTGAELHLGRA